MAANKAINASFLAYIQLFDCFKNIPTYSNGAWRFADSTGLTTGVEIVAKSGLRMTIPSDYINSQQYIVGGQPFNYERVFKSPATISSSTAFVFRCGFGASQKGIACYTVPSGYIGVAVCDGISTVNKGLPISTNTQYKLTIDWDGTATGVMTITLNEESIAWTPGIAWAGNSNNVFYEGFTSNTILSTLYYSKLNNYFKFVLNNGNYATVIYNVAGSINGIKQGGVYVIEQCDILEPFAYTEGVTLYYRYSNRFNIIPIIGNRDDVIPNYNRIGYFPAGSGILSRLVNTYKFPNDATLATIPELIAAGIYVDGSPDIVAGSVITNLEKNTQSYLDYTKYPFRMGYIKALDHLKTKTIVVNDIYLKEFYSIGDSLCGTGYWQDHLCELTAGIFNNATNNDILKPLSIGGTQTAGHLGDCGQARLKNLIDTVPTAKVLFYENINDYGRIPGYLGTFSDTAFMLQNIINIADQGLQSTDAAAWWTANFDNLVATYPYAKGTSINIPYYTLGVNVKITALPTIAGAITLTIDGNVFSIQVNGTETVESLLTKVLNCQFGLFIDAQNVDDISIDFALCTTITFGAGITGMGVSISATSTAQKYSPHFFIGNSESDWTNPAKWAQYVTLWSAYRGIFEYVQTNLPDALFYLFIPTRFNIAIADYTLGGGGFNYDSYYLSAGYLNYKIYTDFQKEVAALYPNVIVLDVESEIFNTICDNFATYYYDNNVHPNMAGHILWAETIKALIEA